MGAGLGTPPVGVGKIKINDHQGRGWTESYLLVGATYSECHTNFAPILNYRHSVLASGLFVTDWSISDSNRSGDSFKSHAGVSLIKVTVDAEAIGPPNTMETCNNLQAAINVRFATGSNSDATVPTGKGFTKQFRGCRDSWQANASALLTLGGEVLSTYVPTALANGMTKVQLWKSFLRKVLDGSTFVQYVPAVPVENSTNNRLLLYSAIVRPYLASRDTGRDPTASKGRIRRRYV